MKPVLYYFLQVILSSGILYGYYHFFLRNNRFHLYNRFYLLAATVISVIVPFLDIPVYLGLSGNQSYKALHTLSVISTAGSDDSIMSVRRSGAFANWLTWENLAFGFYLLISFIVLIRILVSLLNIRRIIRHNPAEQIGSIHFVNTAEPGTPFSFFRWLFWNRDIELQSEKGEQVFRHELFHIKQKHSWDIIYAELLTVVFWINPFFHLVKKEIKAIHEFLADQFAATENTKWQYAEMLLMHVLHTKQHLVNPFFHNQIKRRIAMITTSAKPGHQYLRKLMVLPLAAIVAALFAFSYKEKQEKTGKNNFLNSGDSRTNTDTIPPLLVEGNVHLSNNDFWSGKSTVVNLNGKEFMVNKLSVEGADRVLLDAGKITIKTTTGRDTTTKPLIVLDGKKQEPENEILKNLDPGMIERVNVLKGPEAILKYGEMGNNGVIEIFTKKEGSANVIFEKMDVDPHFPGGEQEWRQYLERNLDASAPLKKKAPDGTYTVVIQFIVDKEGNISDVQALTNHLYGMEEEAIRVIKAGPHWVPAVQNGRQVNAYKKQPITFVIGKGDKNFPSKPAAEGQWLTEVVVAGFPTVAGTENKIFDQVENPPHFPGGETAWKQYLQKNANAIVPVDNGAPAGTYKTIIRFIVHSDGTISDIKPLTSHGFGMENEAKRLIEKGPVWVPAKQNGHLVNAYVQQPVTFQVEDQSTPVTKSNQ